MPYYSTAGKEEVHTVEVEALADNGSLQVEFVIVELGKHLLVQVPDAEYSKQTAVKN